MIEELEEFGIGELSPELALIADTTKRVTDELHRFIVGRDDLIEMLILCLLSEGNLLIRGTPGIAKTTTAKLFARVLGCKFNRQQFTSDMLPSDVTGSFIFDQRTQDFRVRKGGIFSNIVMIDEINRATPRTQAALLESMEEKNVTIEGTTFPLERPFMVVATQSSIELEGTYPLPTVQLDRFTARMTLVDPSPSEEYQILELKNTAPGEVAAVTSAHEILRMIDAVKQVHLDEKVMGYIRDLVVGTRNHPSIHKGASPRGSISLMNLSRAEAATHGRKFVIPDDVKHVAHASLSHRIAVAPQGEIEGLTSDMVLDEILAEVPVS